MPKSAKQKGGAGALAHQLKSKDSSKVWNPLRKVALGIVLRTKANWTGYSGKVLRVAAMSREAIGQ